LKRLGKQHGHFSFPMEGYTLALDFPISRESMELMSRLDNITASHGGRINLAKDSRMSSNLLAKTDSRAAIFHNYRVSESINKTFSSNQSIRLNI